MADQKMTESERQQFLAGLKGRLAASVGRASLCAQQEELPYKYVSVEGPVEIDALGDDATFVCGFG